LAAIGLKQLAGMCRQIGVALRAGLDIRKVWQHETQRGSQGHQHRAQQVLDQINDGDALAEAMRSVSPYFPALTCDLVEVGETAGRLEEVFQKLADHYDHMFKLRRQFFGDIAWPMIQLGLSLLVIGGMICLLSVLVPDQGYKVLIFSCDTKGLLLYIATVGSAVGCLAALVLSVMRGWLGALPMAFLSQLPIVGGCINTMALSRFSWSLSMALNAGVDARKSMKLALRSTRNRHFMSQGKLIDQTIMEGQSFHEALQITGIFPRDFLDAFETAEISGTQSESLDQLAVYYQEKAETAAKMLTRVASVLIWIMTAGIIIMLIFQLFNDFILKTYNEAFDFLENG
jgi:type IV pilus assembly protein PilC